LLLESLPVAGEHLLDDEPELIYVAPKIECRNDNCRWGIMREGTQLPYQNLPVATLKTHSDRLRWQENRNLLELPSDEWSVTLGCFLCGQIATCSAADIVVYGHGHLPVGGGEAHAQPNLFHVEWPCAVKDCRSRTTIYVDIGGADEDTLRDYLREGHFLEWKTCGHWMKTIPDKWYWIHPVTSRLW
jgi:hypothetical protein